MGKERRHEREEGRDSRSGHGGDKQKRHRIVAEVSNCLGIDGSGRGSHVIDRLKAVVADHGFQLESTSRIATEVSNCLGIDGSGRGSHVVDELRADMADMENQLYGVQTDLHGYRLVETGEERDGLEGYAVELKMRLDEQEDAMDKQAALIEMLQKQVKEMEDRWWRMENGIH